jgi:hypothetical protein
MAVLDKEPPQQKGEQPLYNAVFLHRWPIGTPYPRVVDGITKALDGEPFARGGKAVGNVYLTIDATEVGRPVVDMFKRGRRSAHLDAITITGGHKVNNEDGYQVPKRVLVSTLQVALQTARLKIASQLQEAPTLSRELQNFQLTATEQANDTYEGRRGSQSDLVLAVALALWRGSNDGVGIFLSW